MPGLKPFIISQDIGKLRCGQLLLRTGSSTRGMTLSELQNIFMSDESPYVNYIIKKFGLHNQELMAKASLMKQYRDAAKDADNDIYRALGLQPPD